MKEFGYKTPDANLSDSGLNSFDKAYWNLSPEELVQHALDKNMGTLSDKGALVIKTGKFTGRSPKDRFIVKDNITKDEIWWSNINLPFEEEKFDPYTLTLFDSEKKFHFFI